MSLLDNAGTRGDAQGTVPVFLFAVGVALATTADLVLTLKQFGPMKLGLRGTDTGNGNVVVMVELDVIVIP